MAKRARIIVVGCSLFGCAVAQALSAAGHDVIVVDMQEDALEGKVNFLIKVLKFIIAESGFELLARIEIKDKKTGRCFR